MAVEDAMMTNPVHCLEEDPSEKVAEQMLEHDLTFLLVTDREGLLKGYVNLYDLRGHKGEVGDVVRPMTLTVSPRQNLKHALSRMLGYDLGIVVAVDESGKLQGVLNSRTLVAVIGETYDEHGGHGGHWGKITAHGRIL